MKVVAIADFESEDTAALRLNKGDEIRVLQRLASGWWEGAIQDRRGFFPSTFVTTFENSAPSSASSHRKTLPPHWLQKTSPDGKTYYCNVLTNQTCWSLDELDSDSTLADESLSIPYHSNLLSEESEWNHISTHIHDLINRLIQQTRRNEKDNFITISSNIIEAIRSMLYSSNTARKDSPILQNNKPLRTHHRQIMNCLSQLVMAAKSASSIWPPPDAKHLLIMSANDTFIAVQQFISVAMHSHVSLSQVTVNDTSIPTTVKEGQTNVMATLENYITSASELVASFIDLVRSGAYSSPALIVQVRSMVTEVGLFLSLADDISIEEDGEERSNEFKTHRLAVFKIVSDLVTATQTATNSLAPSDASERLVSAAQSIEKGMKDLLISTKFLIEERESREHVALQMYIEKYRDKRRNSHESRRLSLDIQPPVVNQSKLPSPTSPESGGFEKLPSPSQSKVFQKFFGQLPTQTTSTNVDDEQPYYLQHNYGQDDIVLTLQGTVKGGILPALIERLTLHDHYDSEFTQAFMLTYRSFTDSLTLCRLLFERFMMEPPNAILEEHLRLWIEKKQTPVRLRIYNVIKSWIENFCEDMDIEALNAIKEFAQTVMVVEMEQFAEPLVKLVDKRLAMKHSQRSIIQPLVKDIAAPIVPKKIGKLVELDPLEVARQLTLIESEYFSAIHTHEFLRKSWSDKENKKSINVKKMIALSNKMTGWVVGTILREVDVKKRAAAVKFFVMVADRCYFLRNYNSLMAILAALNSSPIHRLRRTWELLSTRTHGMLETLKKVMAPVRNFASYREALRSSQPPCIPFLGVYLTDLTFIEDGNTDFLKQRQDLINFCKFQKTAEVLIDIQQFQTTAYPLQPVTEIQKLLEKEFIFSEGVDLYDISLQLEPKEREDEKIARLLQESGLL